MTHLYKRPPGDQTVAGPFPLGVAIIDKSCLVFAHIFRHTSSKHKLQMFAHFGDCIKNAKAARQEAVLMNTLCALLGALKVSHQRWCNTRHT